METVVTISNCYKNNKGNFCVKLSLCTGLLILYSSAHWKLTSLALPSLFFPPLPVPSLSALLHPLFCTSAPFLSFVASAYLCPCSQSFCIPLYVSYHLPSSLAGLLRSALWSPKSVFSTAELRWVMSHACLDMPRWSVYVVLTYARLAALQWAGAKMRARRREERRG